MNKKKKAKEPDYKLLYLQGKVSNCQMELMAIQSRAETVRYLLGIAQQELKDYEMSKQKKSGKAGD